MNKMVNPQFILDQQNLSNSTTVADWLPKYLTILHTQQDIVYSGEIKSMPNVNYTIVSFDGRKL